MLKKIFSKKIISIPLGLFGLFAPFLYAQATIVTCDKCGLCDLFVVGKNIIDFLWWQISFPLAILMIVVAAFFFIISGGNPSLHTRGKSIATAAVVGLFITFGSWLIISVAINTIARPSYLPWPWNKPTCTAPPQVNTCAGSGGTCLSACPILGTGIAIPPGGWNDCPSSMVCCSN